MLEQKFFTEIQFGEYKRPSWEAFQSLNIKFIKDNIVNKELSIPIMNQRISNFWQATQEYLRHYNAFSKKINGTKAIVARYWILFVFLVCFSRKSLRKRKLIC